MDRRELAWKQLMDWCQKHPFVTFNGLEIRDGLPVLGSIAVQIAPTTIVVETIKFNL